MQLLIKTNRFDQYPIMQMSLEDLGYNGELEEYRREHGLSSFEIGRVISEHKDRYTVQTNANEYDAELLGNLRFTATNRNDLPAVGDWVSISEYDGNKAIIHAVLPRKSILERKAVGKLGQTQIIATNIDFGLIVQSVNRDFNINRLERYMTICHTSKVEPIIVLSKVDLIEKKSLQELLNQVKERLKNVPVYAISNQTQFGIDEIKTKLIRGKTYCLLGSSGVGKSTLINTLTGVKLMETGEISQSIDRGKHVTSHRELIVLDKGIIIDNPGMREVGITSTPDGLEMTFDEILSLAQNCRFSDCTHTHEKGCAVLAAIENESLDPASYANFLKMQKEKIHFESDAIERKRKDKDFGKMIKRVQKQRRNNKY
ncbi:ribosome small subunit-dependent GTPase A [Arenibacter sp. F20364]|uniref:ribosome small subunit-dependent GTPase A n=1 Tax=Arenibacter sp. F20364 TaxID=2926415 RepID=UPI001FF1EA76|nr:ribosome small subunit-dependent GTPase A [Arenibacter sp. F20364]MCK0190291.1 ribosome small subunit-dependent GTPase A [Arenibacter sp. F20364]